jgi:hypothetical protein
MVLKNAASPRVESILTPFLVRTDKAVEFPLVLEVDERKAFEVRHLKVRHNLELLSQRHWNIHLKGGKSRERDLRNFEEDLEELAIINSDDPLREA